MNRESLRLGPQPTDTDRMEVSDRREVSTRSAVRDRRRRLLIVAVVGIGLGVSFALRFVDRWGADGAAQDGRIPTAALIYFGVFFAVGGVVWGVSLDGWRRSALRPTPPNKILWGTRPARDTIARWRRVRWDLQDWLVARDQRRLEAMRLDPRIYQLRDAAMALSAGATLLLYAALR